MDIIVYIDDIVKSEPLRLVFSNKSDKNYDYKKVKINLTKAKDRKFYQVEKFTDKQVFHENIELGVLPSYIKDMMDRFRQLTAISEDYNFDIRISKKGKIFYSKHSQKNELKIDKNHNKKKNYILEEGMDIPAFVDLGIFSKDGKIINSKYDKYKQINRFIEIIDDEVKKLPSDYIDGKDKVLRILDFGCGKSYLTFVVYYYFVEIRKMNVEITGLDLKEDVINKCKEVAQKYGYDRLKFELGDINGYKLENNVDIVISLHACDTATDYALFNAVNWKAKMIFSVPCCQHEINASIKADKLSIITRYGLIQERMAALMTDSIRANILEAMGYKTQLIEFIDFEHSPKNILIRAVRSKVSREKRKKLIDEIEALRSEFSFEQTLYSLLKDSL
ncbi:methyltransferase [Peptostreptococcus sp. MV1]|uniref:class I SAM-dependent methyltransferase n=1 Tax=Peptostreptococcus sp. MV1 TaxID=1219626 RepID=UPI00050D9FDC|nr:SAM-dependent methyltransferase [Peptostreptococcus sp. MV1]KGF10546.1 methyltransferase [Peptostreptococcus sp. MV1]